MSCDEFCSHESHPFLYKLNSMEKKYIQTVTHRNIYMNGKYDFSKETILTGLIRALDDHFKENPNSEYFLRLNKLSPKDAYYFIENTENENDDMTIDTIKRDIEYLHVSASTGKMTEHCINVLLHSDRVYCEIAFDDEESTELSVLLLNYISVNHKTETRCYVHNNNLIAISQYYCEMTNVYNNPENVTGLIGDFFENLKQKVNIESYVFDVHIDTKEKIELIELNPYNHTTDPCLFTWDELDNLNCLDTKLFRYKHDDKKISVSF